MMELIKCVYKAKYSKYSLEALHSNNKKQSIQMEHNRTKKPNWQEAASCLFTSVEEDLNLKDREQIQQVVRAGLEPDTAGYRV